MARLEVPRFPTTEEANPGRAIAMPDFVDADHEVGGAGVPEHQVPPTDSGEPGSQSARAGSRDLHIFQSDSRQSVAIYFDVNEDPQRSSSASHCAKESLAKRSRARLSARARVCARTAARRPTSPSRSLTDRLPSAASHASISPRSARS